MKSFQDLDFNNMSAEESELMEECVQSKSPAPGISRDAQKKTASINPDTQKVNRGKSTDKKRSTLLVAPRMGVSENPPQQGPQIKNYYTLDKKLDYTATKPQVIKKSKSRSKSKSIQKKVFF